MLELDEPMGRALSEHYGPAPGAKTRVLEQLRAQLDGPHEPDEPDEADGPDAQGGSDAGPGDPTGAAPSGGPLAGAGQAAWAAKVVTATLSLTGAGLLTIKLGALAVSSLSSGQAPAGHEIETAGAEPAPTLQSPHAHQAAPTSTLEQDHKLGESTPRPAHDTKKTATSTRSAPPANSKLAAELALIHAAETWREKDPHAALAKLEEHRRLHARGALSPEREVLRVELLCALDRPAQAAVARDAFLASRDDPQLRARVDASCVGTGSDQSGN